MWERKRRPRSHVNLEVKNIREFFRLPSILYFNSLSFSLCVCLYIDSELLLLQKPHTNHPSIYLPFLTAFFPLSLSVHNDTTNHKNGDRLYRGRNEGFVFFYYYYYWVLNWWRSFCCSPPFPRWRGGSASGGDARGEGSEFDIPSSRLFLVAGWFEEYVHVLDSLELKEAEANMWRILSLCIVNCKLIYNIGGNL